MSVKKIDEAMYKKFARLSQLERAGRGVRMVVRDRDGGGRYSIYVERDTPRTSAADSKGSIALSPGVG